MDIIFLLGRIILGGYFIVSSWGHFKNLEGMAGYATSKGVPSPRAAVFAGGVLLLLGGLGVLFGIAPELSLALLIIFLVPVSYKMHAFWKETDPNKRMMEQIQFMKNMALIGALLMLYAVPWAYTVLQ